MDKKWTKNPDRQKKRWTKTKKTRWTMTKKPMDKKNDGQKTKNPTE